MTNPPALILGGSANALSVARSLSGAGIDVYAVGNSAQDSVCHSRYCKGFFDLGSGIDVQDRWLEWLVGEAPRGVVLPCNDDGLELVAGNRRLLVANGHQPIEANDQVLLAMLDKEATYERARSVGVPSPTTAVVQHIDDLDTALQTIAFPCALKPRRSHRFVRRFGVDVKALLARDRAELEAAVARTAALGLEMILTEIILGSDDQLCSYYSYLDERGEPLFHFTKRKLRQFPTGFGLGSYQITDWNGEVAELGLRFFQGIGLRGLAAVEFKRDARDGRLKLIECNHRFTAANEQVRIAGLDLALLVYNRVVGRPLPPLDTYRRDVRLWHPLEDLRAFLDYRRRGELSFWPWVRTLLHRQHFPLFRWSDPLPTVFSLYQVSWRVARDVAGRARLGRTEARVASG